jgi:signal transduction histidine kinase/CheY-like chemotaxis protein
MKSRILTVEIRFESDVVKTRQRARQLAGLLGFDVQDQTRVATAVSEIARNAMKYAGGGVAEFAFEAAPKPTLLVHVRDKGPGIGDVDAVLSGRYDSPSGMGLGLVGARRLMDRFELSTSASGTVVTLGKVLPSRAAPVTSRRLGQLSAELALQAPSDPLEEIRQQNRELLTALTELRKRQEELAMLNRELEDTNRGVVALYAELDEKAESLKRANEIKGRFLSNMSHEFRTPLNAVLSLADILLERYDGPLVPEQEKQIRLIRKAAESLTELVNDLLDLAKVEAGKLTLKPVRFEVEELFGALRGMLRPLLAHNTSIALNFEVPPELPELYTDEGKVSQILRNLISNALKFTEQGEVRVTAQVGHDETIRLSVADTGIGIAREDQARIFQEFSQVDSPIQKKVKGTGLGLPLSKKLAELLGGRIAVRSVPGEGSTFTLVLPLRYAGPLEISIAPEPTRELDPTRLPVLIVEDNPEALFAYEKYLKGTGFQVIPARSLEEARGALRRFRPLAIVLDILLEHEVSWGFIEELKADSSTRTIPLIVATVIENQEKAVQLGADLFHAKPVERSWLLAQLEAVAGRTRPTRILVIEDDEVSLYVVRNLLADTRLEVVEATSGREGLRLARELQPEIILLDLGLPDLAGGEVLEELKASRLTARIPVIVNTSHILDDAHRERLSRHAVAILPKEMPSRDAAVTALRSALTKAGLGQRIAPEEGDARV